MAKPPELARTTPNYSKMIDALDASLPKFERMVVGEKTKKGDSRALILFDLNGGDYSVLTAQGAFRFSTAEMPGVDAKRLFWQQQVLAHGIGGHFSGNFQDGRLHLEFQAARTGDENISFNFSVLSSDNPDAQLRPIVLEAFNLRVKKFTAPKK